MGKRRRGIIKKSNNVAATSRIFLTLILVAGGVIGVFIIGSMDAVWRVVAMYFFGIVIGFLILYLIIRAAVRDGILQAHERIEDEKDEFERDREANK